MASRLATLTLILNDLLNQRDFAKLDLNTVTQRDGRRLSVLPLANMAIDVLSDQINRKPHALPTGDYFLKNSEIANCPCCNKLVAN